MSKTTVTINRIKKTLDSISGLCYDDRLAEIETYVNEKVSLILGDFKTATRAEWKDLLEHEEVFVPLTTKMAEDELLDKAEDKLADMLADVADIDGWDYNGEDPLGCITEEGLVDVAYGKYKPSDTVIQKIRDRGYDAEIAIELGQYYIRIKLNF